MSLWRTLPASCILLLSATLGCGRSKPEPIPIGHIEAPGETAEFRAIEAAMKAVNEDSTQHLLERPVQVRSAFGGPTPNDWAAQAARLVGLNRVRGLVAGDRWEQVERIAAVLQTEAVITVSPAGWTGPTVPRNGFTVGLAPAARGRALALLAEKLVKDHKVGVSVRRDPESQHANQVANAFATACKKFGPVREVSLEAPAAKDREIVLLACSAADAIRLRDRLGGGFALFAGDEAELADLAADPHGAMVWHVATAVDPADTTEGFVRFKEAYGETPTALAVLAHDAAAVWMEAVRRAKSLDPKDVRKELLRDEEAFEGLLGPLTFAADHTARRRAFVGTWQGGKFTRIGEPIAPSGS